MLICRLGGGCGRGGILPPRAETDDASSNGQHPEHAVDGVSVCSGRQDATYHNHQRSGDDGDFSTQIVAGQADGDLTDDLADQEGVGDLGADGGGVLLWIFGFQDDVGHGHQVVLVAIADESEARAEDGEQV